MAFDDYFAQSLALNEQAGTVVPGAVARVYAPSDTAYATPLAITDLSGVPMTQLQAGPTGIYPAFRVAGRPSQVIAKSGPVITPLTSVLGAVFEAVPDPAAAPDGQTVVTQAGGFVLRDATAQVVPSPTTGDDGMVMTIVDGVWAAAAPTGGGGTVTGVLDGGAP